MKKIWVIIGNFQYVYIYSVGEINFQIQLINKLLHEENKLKKSDLVADQPGRYAKGFNSNIIGSYAATTDPKLVEIDNFIREICNYLEKGRKEKKYIGIIIVSNPSFYGLIKKFAHKNLIKYIKHHRDKDYVKMSETKLKSIIKNTLLHQINSIFID